MKARLIFTYIIVILISVVVLKSYIMSAMSASLYNDNRVNMVTKINIIATDISGVPEEEIAEAMNCSLGTIKSRINRSRLALRKLLENDKELFI